MDAVHNHLMLVDLTAYDVTGKALEKLLDEAHITANKNTIPNDPRSPFVTSKRKGTNHLIVCPFFLRIHYILIN